jgi:hypothetical protein
LINAPTYVASQLHRAYKAEADGEFVGLVQDLDDQKILLGDRLETWLLLISRECGLAL